MSLFSDLPSVSQARGTDEVLVSQSGTFGRATRSNLYPGLDSDAAYNVVTGSGSLPRNATDGFLYVPVMSGAPSGTPTTKAGRAAVCFDITNKQLWAYLNGVWVPGSGM